MNLIWENVGRLNHAIPGELPAVCILLVYVFYDRQDAQLFFSSGKRAFKHAALLTVGFCPDPQSVSSLGLLYPNAKLVLLLGTDLPAIVLSCKIALWMAGKDAEFRLCVHELYFCYAGWEMHCPVADFSLSRFCCISGFRTVARCLSP